MLGGSVSLVFADINIANRVRACKAGELGDISKSFWPLTEIEMELARVKSENAEQRCSEIA